jgi:hypothetical protein
MSNAAAFFGFLWVGFIGLAVLVNLVGPWVADTIDSRVMTFGLKGFINLLIYAGFATPGVIAIWGGRQR